MFKPKNFKNWKKEENIVFQKRVRNYWKKKEESFLRIFIFVLRKDNAKKLMKTQKVVELIEKSEQDHESLSSFRQIGAYGSC